jgi:bacterioferritin-associated ferredoxin
MIVCICNNINSSTIKATIKQGACSVEDVKTTTGAASCCGKCQFKVNALVQDTLSEISFPQEANQA